MLSLAAGGMISLNASHCSPHANMRSRRSSPRACATSALPAHCVRRPSAVTEPSGLVALDVDLVAAASLEPPTGLRCS